LAVVQEGAEVHKNRIKQQSLVTKKSLLSKG